MNYQNVFAPVQHLRAVDIFPGGMCHAKFARWEDVLSFPAVNPNTGISNSTIVLKDGQIWYEMELADNQKILNETEELDDAGPYVLTELTGYVGGNSAAHIIVTTAMLFSRFVILALEKDGTTWLIGDEDGGAKFIYSFDAGDVQASRKRSLKFSWESVNGAIVYSGNIEAQPTDPIIPPWQRLGDFNDDFNPDFNI